MMQVEGEVKYYDVKPLQNGNFIHSVNIDGVRYSTFAKDGNPRANKGDSVRFNAEKNQKGYWNIKGQIEVLKRAAGHVSGGGGGNKYPQNDDNRQDSIMRQNAMGHAATIMAACVTSGSVSGLTQDEIAEEVIRLSNEYFFPYAKEGKTPEFKGGGVSEFEPSKEEAVMDDDIPF